MMNNQKWRKNGFRSVQNGRDIEQGAQCYLVLVEYIFLQNNKLKYSYKSEYESFSPNIKIHQNDNLESYHKRCDQYSNHFLQFLNHLAHDSTMSINCFVFSLALWHWKCSQWDTICNYHCNYDHQSVNLPTAAL